MKQCRGSVMWALVLCRLPAAAEVPPRTKAELTRDADLVVTGKVTAVQITRVKPSAPTLNHEERHRLTVRVAKVLKGRPAVSKKPVLADGYYYDLKEGLVGTAGHRSSNTSDRIAAVEKGWELTLYLKVGKGGVYDGGR